MAESWSWMMPRTSATMVMDPLDLPCNKRMFYEILHIRLYFFTYIYIYKILYIYIYIYIFQEQQTNVYIYISTHVCIYIYIHMYMYICHVLVVASKGLFCPYIPCMEKDLPGILCTKDGHGNIMGIFQGYHATYRHSFWEDYGNEMGLCWQYNWTLMGI